MRLTAEETLAELTNQIRDLFVLHNIPRLYVPAIPHRRVISRLIELHCYAKYCTRLMQVTTNNERLLRVFDHCNPTDAKYFTMRDELIDLMQKDFLSRTRRKDREEGEIRVMNDDRLLPLDSIIPSFLDRILGKLKGLVKK